MLEMILPIKLDHYKYKTGIYGNASKKQIKELKDEGIETYVFPWIENKNN